MYTFNNKGGRALVEITEFALSKIKKEVKGVINEGKKPFIRLAMGGG